MTVSEQTAITGSAAQTGLNRYGDYAHMSIDPDGTTFWFTGEYLGTGGNTRTRIFSFDLANSIGIEEAATETTSSQLDVIQANGALQVSLTGLASDDALRFSLIGIDGKEVMGNAVQPSGKRWSATVDVRHLSSGVYFVRLSRSGSQKVERIVIAQ